MRRKLFEDPEPQQMIDSPLILPGSIPPPPLPPRKRLPQSFDLIVDQQLFHFLLSMMCQTPDDIKKLLRVNKKFYKAIKEIPLWIPAAISAGHSPVIDASFDSPDQRDCSLSKAIIKQSSAQLEHIILTAIPNFKSISFNHRLAMILMRKGPFRLLTESHVKNLVESLWPADKPADKGLAVTLSLFISENYEYFRCCGHPSSFSFLKHVHKGILLSALCKISMRIETSFESSIDVPAFLNEIGTLLQCNDILHISKLSVEILTPDVSIGDLARWCVAERNLNVRSAWLSIIGLSLEYISAYEYQKNLGDEAVIIPELEIDRPEYLDLLLLLNPAKSQKHGFSDLELALVSWNHKFKHVLKFIGSHVKDLDSIDRQLVMLLSALPEYGEMDRLSSIIMLISVDPSPDHIVFASNREILIDSCTDLDALKIAIGSEFAVHLTPAKKMQILGLPLERSNIVIPALDSCTHSELLLELYGQLKNQPNLMKEFLGFVNDVDFEFLLNAALLSSVSDVEKKETVEIFCRSRPIIAARILIDYIGDDIDQLSFIPYNIAHFVYLFGSDAIFDFMKLRMNFLNLLPALNSYPTDCELYRQACRRIISFLQERKIHLQLILPNEEPVSSINFI